MHEWMLDNGFTPHLVVDAKRDGVHVPEAHVKDGKIVLNVSPTATRSLQLGNDAVTFEARFGGVSQQLVIPVSAVLGIYARETGQGMIFGEDDAPGSGPAPAAPGSDEPPPTPPAGGGKRAKLKVVK
jgi:stringent starvation protein B